MLTGFCAQEVSIRLIHAIQEYQIINNTIDQISPEFKEFIRSHIKRIYPTQIYSKSQLNNHWISEAAALFIGGNLVGDIKLSKGEEILLESSINSLIMSDGSFSQYSTNYHRLVLDTLVQVEIFRKKLKLKPFSKVFENKRLKLLQWLIIFVDPISGRISNLGSNDGTYCYGLHDMPFDDYRPSLQLSSKVFTNKILFDSGLWDQPLFWYELFDESSRFLQIGNQKINLFKEGGYVVLKPSKKISGILRLPIYKFRPPQSDPLHFDLWYEGQNLLMDGGSYSYPNPKDIKYFAGIESHNTVQFDSYEPMPRLSKFLLGDWLNINKPILIDESDSNLKLKDLIKSPYGSHRREVIFLKIINLLLLLMKFLDLTRKQY